MAIRCITTNFREECLKLDDRFERYLQQVALPDAPSDNDYFVDDDDSEFCGYSRADVMAKYAVIHAFVSDSPIWNLANQQPVLVSDEIQQLLSHYGVLPFRERRYRVLDPLWVFKNCGYEVTGTRDDEQNSLLIQEAYDADRVKFERLRNKFSEANQPAARIARPRIPEEIRIAVWRRDSGCCARCGSRERLEYDHIIPLSKGGSNTVRNIELLCEACNRSKGDQIQ